MLVTEQEQDLVRVQEQDSVLEMAWVTVTEKVMRWVLGRSGGATASADGWGRRGTEAEADWWAAWWELSANRSARWRSVAICGDDMEACLLYLNHAAGAGSGVRCGDIA